MRIRYKDIAVLYIYALVGYFILAAIYIFYIFPVWEGGGFTLDFNLFKVVISVILLGGFTAIVSQKTGEGREFFLVLILLIQFIPSIVLYSIGGGSWIDSFIIFFGILIVFVVSSIRFEIKINGFISDYILNCLFIFCSCISVWIVVYLDGLKNFNLNINDVYEFRREILNDAPIIFNYILPVITKFMIPFGVVISLRDRNYIFLLAFFGCSIALFGLTSHKSIVFYVCFAAVLYVFWGCWRKAWLVAVLFAVALVAGLVDALIFRFTDLGWPTGLYASFGIRRALMVPALLNYLHIEFFRENALAFWSNSRITLGLLDYPYDLSIPNVIGREFYGSAETSANTGHLGSGFAQAGVLGLVIYSAGVGLVIAFLDALGRRIGHRVVVAAVSAQVVTMVLSADFVTMFLTHGLAVSLLFLLAVRPHARTENAAVDGRAL